MNSRVLIALLFITSASQAFEVGFKEDEKQPLEIAFQAVGTEKPTSFPKLIFTHITNPGFTPLDLGKAIRESEMIIDGKPAKRLPKPFLGMQGLAPMGEWEGCISFEDYTPMITPGNHKVSMKIMGMQTPNYKVKWIEPVDWRKGNLKSRKKELDQLAAVLVDGLPQTCVEYWLTVKDGGQQDEDKVRYFLEPNFKMTVPYRKMYASTGLHSVVDDKVKVYEENKIHD